MSKLEWDKIGERLYETGVDKGVIYLLRHGRYSDGKAWSGLINVNESPSGAEPTPLYADNIKYLNLISSEDFGASVEAYTYPVELSECLGKKEIAAGVFIGQQRRLHFGFVYRTLLGNDIDGTDLGYKLHIIFDCIAAPSENAHNTINESPEASTYSWDFSTTQHPIEGHKPSAKLSLTSTDFKKSGLFNVFRYIQGILFGTDSTNPKIPTISEISEAFELQMYLRDNYGDTLLDSSGNNIQSRVFE